MVEVLPERKEGYMEILELLDPTTESDRGRGILSPRLETLEGKTIGVIWNGRVPGNEIINGVLEELRERYRLKEVLFRAKPFLGNVAPLEILDETARSCDAVITGVGD